MACTWGRIGSTAPQPFSEPASQCRSESTVHCSLQSTCRSMQMLQAQHECSILERTKMTPQNPREYLTRTLTLTKGIIKTNTTEYMSLKSAATVSANKEECWLSTRCYQSGSPVPELRLRGRELRVDTPRKWWVNRKTCATNNFSYVPSDTVTLFLGKNDVNKS